MERAAAGRGQGWPLGLTRKDNRPTTISRHRAGNKAEQALSSGGDSGSGPGPARPRLAHAPLAPFGFPVDSFAAACRVSLKLRSAVESPGHIGSENQQLF